MKFTETIARVVLILLVVSMFAGCAGQTAQPAKAARATQGMTFIDKVKLDDSGYSSYVYIYHDDRYHNTLYITATGTAAVSDSEIGNNANHEIPP